MLMIIHINWEIIMYFCLLAELVFIAVKTWEIQSHYLIINNNF